jgi:hypothetical protein
MRRDACRLTQLGREVWETISAFDFQASSTLVELALPEVIGQHVLHLHVFSVEIWELTLTSDAQDFMILPDHDDLSDSGDCINDEADNIDDSVRPIHDDEEGLQCGHLVVMSDAA